MREALPIEEAPEARAGPRSPDVFYRGEEAGAAPKPTVNNDNGNYLAKLRLKSTSVSKDFIPH